MEESNKFLDAVSELIDSKILFENTDGEIGVTVLRTKTLGEMIRKWWSSKLNAFLRGIGFNFLRCSTNGQPKKIVVESPMKIAPTASTLETVDVLRRIKMLDSQAQLSIMEQITTFHQFQVLHRVTSSHATETFCWKILQTLGESTAIFF